jgi:hypothetical protein
VTVSAAKVMLTCCSREGPHPAMTKLMEIVRNKITLKPNIFLMGFNMETRLTPLRFSAVLSRQLWDGTLDKPGKVFLQYFYGGFMDIHHVPGFIVAHADMVLQLLLETEPVKSVLGGKVGSCQIEKPVCHVDFQVWIDTHGVTQRYGHVDVPVFMVCIGPG